MRRSISCWKVVVLDDFGNVVSNSSKNAIRYRIRTSSERLRDFNTGIMESPPLSLYHYFTRLIRKVKWVSKIIYKVGVANFYAYMLLAPARLFFKPCRTSFLPRQYWI